MRPLTSFNPTLIAAAQAAQSAADFAAWKEFEPTIPLSALAWERLESTPDGAKYRHVLSGMTLIVSVAREADDCLWVHASCAHRNRLPSWSELGEVKEAVFGKLRKAIRFSAESEYVNINPHVLHLWSCLDGDKLPDFTGGSGSI